MSLQVIGYYLFALLVGALGGIHIPISGAMGHRIGSTLVAIFVFFGVAFSLAAIGAFIQMDRGAFAGLRSVPWWYFLAGVISVVVVGGSTFLIPRIGAVHLFVMVFTAQLIVRSIISHFGWLESPVSPITGLKVLGAVLLVIGATLVVRR